MGVDKFEKYDNKAKIIYGIYTIDNSIYWQWYIHILWTFKY